MICPCCGARMTGDLLRDGCFLCGARAVGEPLSRPEHELPSYGRALFACIAGSLLLGTFLADTGAVVISDPKFSRSFWGLVAAAETAAWRLKWVEVPAAAFAAWVSALISRSILRSSGRLGGLRAARAGLLASCAVAALIVTLIAVTVPERLRQRQRGIEALQYSQGYTLDRALQEYRAVHGRLPTGNLRDALATLPDPDGSIASVLATIDKDGVDYKPFALEAALPKRRGRTPMRGAMVRPVSTTAGTDDAVDEGISYTNYEIVLPGEDKILGTADDWKIRDGIIYRPSPQPSATAPERETDRKAP